MGDGPGGGVCGGVVDAGGVGAVSDGIDEALALTRWYAREHVVLCLLPAFFIAGAIAAFVQPGVGA